MRRAKAYFFLLISTLIFSSTFSYGQAWSGILAPERATDWTYAGIPGGIPSGSWSNCTTTACDAAFSNPSVANVRAACASAPNNTVVRIPAGSYTWGSSVYCNRGHVVLQGAGTQQTFITLGPGASIYISGQGTGGQGPWPTNVGTTNWTGGLAQGSTVLTVGSTSGLSSGQTVVLAQKNASYVFPDGVEGTCISGNSCGVNITSKSFDGAENYAQIQEVSIVSVNSSTQITIAPPGVGFVAQSGLSPTLFYWNSPHNVQYGGIENMSVNVNDNDHALSLPFCDYCWVKNVALTNATNRGSIFFYYGYRDEADNNYIGGDTGVGHPTQYGIDLLETTLARVENNIIVNLTSPIMTEGSFGTVLGYNYARRTISDNQYGAFDTHLAHAFMQLWEGNVGGTIEYDNSWGSASHMTSFRNYMNGHDQNATNYRVAMKVNAHNHYMNLVGNVVGDPTFHTQYVCDQAHQQGTDNFEYDLGFWDSCDHGTGNYDAVTGSSLIRWANWDAVTWKANGNTNGVRYCTGSGSGSSGPNAGNSACTASETGSADPTYPGLANPSTTLPASFYLSGQPSWWATTWGTPVYPAIGPDVACTTNCNANTASHAALIPAQLCYNKIAKDGNGFLTAFDPNTCYPDDSSSVGSQGAPAPPSGLSATVQ
jgi:hypothetical protein